MSKRRALVSMLLLLSSGALADDLVGQASVIDGDTLEIHGTRIRLWGIDAPESSQLCRGEDSSQYRCGAQAANDLSAYIARRPVNCVPLSLDRYGRTVATCSVDSADLAEWLVRNGLALDWLQYSKGRYDRAQRDAEHAGRGIWKGSYVEPWLYRACIRANGKPSACSDDASAHLDGTSMRSVNPERAMIVSHSGAGGSSLVWATHVKPSIRPPYVHTRTKMAAANRELPVSGYALEVDGRLKAEFATKDGARAGGEELKKRFPMLQIRIYDAQTNGREEIQIL